MKKKNLLHHHQYVEQHVYQHWRLQHTHRKSTPNWSDRQVATAALLKLPQTSDRIKVTAGRLKSCIGDIISVVNSTRAKEARAAIVEKSTAESDLKTIVTFRIGQFLNKKYDNTAFSSASPEFERLARTFTDEQATTGRYSITVQDEQSNVEEKQRT